MKINFKQYKYTPILGWSSSRYELFQKCKRHYYYTYYTKFVKDTPLPHMQRLKNLTSVPLEVGNVVHHIIEAFLKRLQQSDAPIDFRLRNRFPLAHKIAISWQQQTPPQPSRAPPKARP